MKILVVDDIAINRKLLRVTLEAEAHEIVEAADGVEALHVLERETVDAVISDILMPNMDGFRLCHEVRKRDRLRALPFIFYTSTYTSPEDVKLAQTIGADNYLTKPASTQAILQALGEAVRKSGGRLNEAPEAPDEAYVLKQYSQALVHKLEEKNAELHQALQVQQRAHDRIVELNSSLQRRVEERTAELERTHKRLLDVSHQSGMAEVAVNVIHQVGNVLNSVKVSVNLLSDRATRSRAANLARVAALLKEHEPDLAAFVAHDAKGRQLPAYLAQLADQLLGEQSENQQELRSLQVHVDRIREVVQMQQRYTGAAGIIESMNVGEMVDDVLRLSADCLAQAGVRVIRDFAQVPPVSVDRHKVLQIMSNLVRNAASACAESGHADRTLTLRILESADCITIAVNDNGIGLAPDILTRIFAADYAGRKNGDGFGLHSGALVAKALGGRLTAHSDGSGSGATFSLDLPLQTANDRRRPELASMA